MNYIIVKTWNGDDIAIHNNIVGTEIFESSDEIFKKLLELTLENEKGCVEYYRLDRTDRRNYTITYGDSIGNAGTYQIIELNESIYGVAINCNQNDVEVMTKDQFKNFIEELRSEDCEEDDLFFDDHSTGIYWSLIIIPEVDTN